MRDIKYRAWDIELKLMWYPNGEKCDQVLMQFTGLHDKNGKEIYEGDIVKLYFIDDEEIEYSTMDVVTFKNGCFQCENADVPLYFYNIEIIGNIHESKV